MALVGVGGRGQWFVDTIPRMQQVVAVCDVNEEKIDGAFRHWEEAGARYSASAHEWERRAGAEFQRLLREPTQGLPRLPQDDRRNGRPDRRGRRGHAGPHPRRRFGRGDPRRQTRLLREAVDAHAARIAGPARVGSRAPSRHVDGQPGNLQRRVPPGAGTDPKWRRWAKSRRCTCGTAVAVPIASSRQQGEQPVPTNLDWDLWLGPAAMRPYHREWMQRHLWREFGTCQLGNWASHSANLGFMALKVHDLWLAEPGTAKSDVEGHGPGVAREPTLLPALGNARLGDPGPGRTAADYDPLVQRSGAGCRRVACTAYWRPRPQKDRNNWRFAGTLIVGTKGTIHTTGHNMWFQLLPDGAVRRRAVQSPGNGREFSRSGAGLVRGLSRWSAPLGQLRLRLGAQRVSHARQRRHAVRGDAGVRSDRDEDRQQRRGRRLVAKRVSQGLDALTECLGRERNKEDGGKQITVVVSITSFSLTLSDRRLLYPTRYHHDHSIRRHHRAGLHVAECAAGMVAGPGPSASCPADPQGGGGGEGSRSLRRNVARCSSGTRRLT